MKRFLVALLLALPLIAHAQGIRTLLDAEPDRTRWPAIKAEEISRTVTTVPRETRTRGIEIEIVNTRDARGGVLEVFIRAWQDGAQIGFGPDGSVDIERVRMVNPPIYARDPAGEFERFSIDPDNGVRSAWRFRYDPREALLQDLVHTVSVKQQKVVGSTAIVRGRIGSTTSTFFAGPGNGRVIHSGQTDWNTAHNAATGTAVAADENPIRVTVREGSGGNWEIGRAFFPFDTSALPDADTISAVTFSAYCVSLTENGDNDGNDFFVPVGPTTQASNTTLTTADYDTAGAIDNPTELSADRKDFDVFVLNEYANWTLNAAGIAATSKTSYTKIGLREGHDILDLQTTGGPNVGTSQLRFSGQAQTGTTQDPKLVVEHAAGGGFVRPGRAIFH